MIYVCQTFQAWILQHFLRVSDWASVSTYTEDMLYATAFAPLRGNQTTDPFIVYLDRLVAEGMQFNNYVDHREMQPFDKILLYFGWLACESRLTAPRLPERVMQ